MQRSPIKRAPLRKLKGWRVSGAQDAAKLSAELKRAKSTAERQKQHIEELRAALLELRARLTKVMKSLPPR